MSAESGRRRVGVVTRLTRTAPCKTTRRDVAANHNNHHDVTAKHNNHGTTKADATEPAPRRARPPADSNPDGLRQFVGISAGVVGALVRGPPGRREGHRRHGAGPGVFQRGVLLHDLRADLGDANVVPASRRREQGQRTPRLVRAEGFSRRDGGRPRGSNGHRFRRTYPALCARAAPLARAARATLRLGAATEPRRYRVDDHRATRDDGRGPRQRELLDMSGGVSHGAGVAVVPRAGRNDHVPAVSAVRRDGLSTS